MRFSKRYRGFEDWLSTQDRHTGYIRRITRLHSLYPKASLDQLRGHAIAEAKRLSTGVPKPVSARAWNTLSPREQLARERALEVLSRARRSNQSLSKLSREYTVDILYRLVLLWIGVCITIFILYRQVLFNTNSNIVVTIFFCLLALMCFEGFGVPISKFLNVVFNSAKKANELRRQSS